MKLTIEHLAPISAVKVGRCFNGAERDRGTIVHLVPPLPVGFNGDWFTKALCGTEPGRRGNGWSRINKDATCPKCLNRYELQITTKIKQNERERDKTERKSARTV